MILSEEVSVVVQGSVDNKAASIKSLESIRKILPKAEIILSTWKGSDVEGLDCDILVLNEDPGAAPLFKENPERKNNMNRQIRSTQEGIKRATRKYCLKYRTDLALINDKFLSYFGLYKKRSDNWKILSERVICNYATHPCFRAFHPTDITCFGLTEDVLKIWDIPLANEDHLNYFLHHDYPKIVQSKFYGIAPKVGAEMYIWTSFLKKYTDKFGDFSFRHNWDGTKKNIWLTELTIANNLLVLDREDFDFEPLVHKYLLDPVGKKTWMDHDLWLYYYKKHCAGASFWDISFHIIYPIKIFRYRLKNCPTVKKFFKALFKPSVFNIPYMIRLYKEIE